MKRAFESLPPHSSPCPRCAAPLVVDAVAFGQRVVCSECRATFTRREPGFAPRTSAMAISSLVMGIASLGCMCVAGIPAIVLGIFALREINRSGGAITGRRLATWGIATGALFGFLCGPIALAFVLPAIQLLAGKK